MSSTDRYAAAIDLGTTTIAAALVSIPDGRCLARSGSLNPQRSFGLDVITRLGYADQSAANLQQLTRVINEELCRLIADLTKTAKIAPKQMETVAIAGNPAMSHLLMGLPVDSLVRPPFRPKVTTGHCFSTKDLGWELQAQAYVFPSPGGFVGGDTIAFLYGLGFPDPGSLLPDHAFFIDLGTNGEIALLSAGKIYAASVAAGPAFEAGNLSCGMAALPGAIDRVTAHDGRLQLRTIGGDRPVGLCGSGVLDTVALLLADGMLDKTGRLLAPEEVRTALGNRLVELESERHFLLYRDASQLVSLSQADIRQVQLAKSAVRAGMEVLLERAGIAEGNIGEVVMTGSFGASLSLRSLKSIGVLTENMVKNARFVSDGALGGVIRFLCSAAAPDDIARLAGRLVILPLSGTPLFERHFMNNMDFAQQ